MKACISEGSSLGAEFDVVEVVSTIIESGDCPSGGLDESADHDDILGFAFEPIRVGVGRELVPTIVVLQDVLIDTVSRWQRGLVCIISEDQKPSD